MWRGGSDGEKENNMEKIWKRWVIIKCLKELKC